MWGLFEACRGRWWGSRLPFRLRGLLKVAPLCFEVLDEKALDVDRDGYCVIRAAAGKIYTKIERWGVGPRELYGFAFNKLSFAGCALRSRCGVIK